MSSSAPTPRSRAAYSMRALGKRDLPPTLQLHNEVFRLFRTVKHDFFAATGFYENANGSRIVLKMGRVADFAGLPLQWLGRRLCQRELGFYKKLADIPAVPKVLGRVGPTGFVLEFISGTPLTSLPRCPDSFFPELQRLFSEIHARNLAYVDADKSQNILLDDHGHPHLIDFQISFDISAIHLPGIAGPMLRQLQKYDIYHLMKHKGRLRCDQLTPEESAILVRRSFSIRLHRLLFKPYFDLRRRTFHRLRATGRLLPEGSK